MKLKHRVHKSVSDIRNFSRNFIRERKYRRIAAHYNLNGYKRVYLVHIRKTGGTSLNNMFLSLSGRNPEQLYQQLAETPGHRLLSNGLIFVGWNVRLIDLGNYFYAFSHTPLHRLNLPRHTCTVSCFRDPLRRVLSHYNMLMDYRLNNIHHPCMETEGQWLGENLDDFLDRIPRHHLLNQLYMFSETLDLDEAVHHVSSLSHVFFLDAFDRGVQALSEKTHLHLQPIHVRRAGYRTDVSDRHKARLRHMLQDEYVFLDRIRRLHP